jgi:flagellar basal-body rod modification protein FlgD
MDTSTIGIGTNVATSAAQAAGNKLSDTFDNFLKLLTTQLKHQDPLSPLDSNEFTAQLVQFTGVEQAIATNKNLEKLLDLQNANLTTAGLGYIGQTVEAEGSTTGLQNGKAAFAYGLDGNAAVTTITIANAAGLPLFSTAGETTAGKHSFTWDGTDAGGNSVPPGTYKIVVTARDAENNPVGTSTSVIGKVTGIKTGENGLVLDISGAKIPADQVVSVQATQDPPA